MRGTWMVAGALLLALQGGCTCCSSDDWVTLGSLKPVDLPKEYTYSPHMALFVTAGTSQAFQVDLGGVPETTGLTWSAQRGTVDAKGVYTAPSTLGADRVEVRLSNGWALGHPIKVVEAPAIVTFSASPERVAVGEAVELKFTCTPTMKVQIREFTPELRTIYFEYSAKGSGAITVKPSATSTYQLTVTNEAFHSVTRTLQVTVGGQA